ncbi:unnamed protein product, partial [Laminaria digitata]
LSGAISPAPPLATWRVFSSNQDVLDGPLPVGTDGQFSLTGIPLFSGSNRVEVVVSGVGQGFGEARCSTTVVSASARERGLRAMLNWDGTSSDLDLHLIGPGAVYGDPMNTLAPRSLYPVFGGEVQDDFDGLGPELLTLSSLPDGVFGLIVEAVSDGADAGS